MIYCNANDFLQSSWANHRIMEDMLWERERETSLHIQESNNLLQSAWGQSLLRWSENWTYSINMFAFIRNFLSFELVPVCPYGRCLCLCTLTDTNASFAVSGVALISVLTQFIRAWKQKASRSKSYVACIRASETFINMQSRKTSHFEAKLEKKTQNKEEAGTHHSHVSAIIIPIGSATNESVNCTL